MFLGFAFAIGAHSIFDEVAGFSPLCLLSFVIIVVHIILSDKIIYHID